MDRPLDRAGGTGPTDDSRPPDDSLPPDDSSPASDGATEDIEAELYCSAREAGVGAVSFGPVGDG